MKQTFDFSDLFLPEDRLINSLADASIKAASERFEQKKRGVNLRDFARVKIRERVINRGLQFSRLNPTRF